MQLRKHIRKQFNRERPCRWCGYDDHVTGKCERKPMSRKQRRELEDYDR